MDQRPTHNLQASQDMNTEKEPEGGQGNSNTNGKRPLQSQNNNVPNKRRDLVVHAAENAPKPVPLRTFGGGFNPVNLMKSRVETRRDSPETTKHENVSSPSTRAHEQKTQPTKSTRIEKTQSRESTTKITRATLQSTQGGQQITQSSIHSTQNVQSTQSMQQSTNTVENPTLPSQSTHENTIESTREHVSESSVVGSVPNTTETADITHETVEDIRHDNDDSIDDTLRQSLQGIQESLEQSIQSTSAKHPNQVNPRHAMHSLDHDEYQSELLDLDDEEQLRILAQQLESAQGNEATLEPGMHSTEIHSPYTPTTTMDHQYDHLASSSGVALHQFQVSDLKNEPPSQLPPLDQTALFKVRTLQVLDNLATQILGVIGESSYQETLNMIVQPESEMGKIFHQLLAMFEQTKSVYTDAVFFSYSELPGYLLRNNNDLIIQRANLVTFAAAVYGSVQVGFYHLNEYFLDTFVQRGGRLLKPQSALYLDLKTQAYISAVGQGRKSQQEILDDLFPRDLKTYLLKHNGERDQIIPSEQDFLDRCHRRRENLERATSQQELTEKYEWLTFLKDLTEYLSRLYHTAIKPTQSTVMPVIPQDTSRRAPPGTTFHVWTKDKVEQRKSNGLRKLPLKKGKELRPLPLSEGTVLDTSGGDTFSAYKAAREATEFEAVDKKGGSSVFSRRHWTTEEEDALLKGLDQVQGPYWSQILELYGPGGSISEVLKDRSQVQLKDKARNLKLFFLKTGTPLPPVFQYVTGDIKRNKGKEVSRTRDSSSPGRLASAETSQSQRVPPTPASNQQSVTVSSTPHNIAPELDSHSMEPMSVEQESRHPHPVVIKDEPMAGSHDDESAETAARLEKLIQSVGEYINHA